MGFVASKRGRKYDVRFYGRGEKVERIVEERGEYYALLSSGRKVKLNDYRVVQFLKKRVEVGK